MSTPRYSMPAIVMHWLQAALVIGLLLLGWSIANMPKGPDKSWAIALHKSLGLCAFFLVVARAIWRLRSAPPVAQESRFAHLATIAHRLLYALLFLVPVAGYLSASFTKYPMKFFGMSIPKAGWPDESINLVFNLLHKGATWTLVALIALHLAGVVYHLLRRDGTLSRMTLSRK